MRWRRPDSRWPRALAALVAAAASSACGDDLAALDAGVSPDARPQADAALIACSPDAGCADDAPTPLCDLSRNVCVECLAAGDCERERSFGPSCETGSGYCRCQTDDDCAGNGNGPYCNEDTRACTCLLDSDCGSEAECELEPYLGIDIRTCRPS